MSTYAWRGKPIEALTREELLEAMTQALDRVAELDEPSIHLSPEALMRYQREKNRIHSNMLDALALSKPK